jgi:hypothetical protein
VAENSRLPAGGTCGRTYPDFVHPDDLDSTIQAVALLNSNTPVERFVSRFRAGDGSYRWLEWQAFPVGGKIYAAAHDISAAVEREQALKRSSTIYAVLGSINEAIVRVTSPEILLQQCCDIAVHRGGFLLAWIGLVDAGGGSGDVPCRQRPGIPAAHQYQPARRYFDPWADRPRNGRRECVMLQ